MKTIDFNYFIERYLAEEMKPAEKEWFEKELRGNPSLSAELDLRRTTDHILREKSDILMLRGKMAAVAREHHYGVRAWQRRFTRYAATVAILIIAGAGIYLFSNRKMSGDALFDKYYASAITAGQSVTRSGNQTLSDDYLQAVNDYRAGNYESAIVHFLQFTVAQKDNPEVYMMLGNSYAETKKYAEAGVSYGKVLEHNNNLYLEDANWLLGLCYLKTGEYNKAISQMTVIAQSDSRYSEDAAIILRRLK